MKRFTLLFMILILTTISYSYAQNNWSEVNFADKYKRKVKIKGKSAKELKNNPTFINAYSISQATTMKGSEKTAKKAIYSEVSLGGLKNEDYQKMVDELYQSFVEQLSKAGLTVTNGKDVLASDYAMKRMGKDKNKEFIGQTGTNTMKEGKKKITEGSMPGYGSWAVTRDVSFKPTNKYIYETTKTVYGNFYQHLASKEDFNLLSVHFYVSFASFDGGRGYKDIKLATKPVLAVSAEMMLITSNGAFNKIYYKKLPVWGSDKWSEGIVKGKDNKSTAEFLGLARSADYAITANSDKYLNEAKAIINNLQKDIVQGIHSNL